MFEINYHEEALKERDKMLNKAELKAGSLKMSKLTSAAEVHKKDMQDPEFRAEWDRTALAREVSELLVGYRVKQGISQTELAKRLGTGQAKVSRLEAGEHTPNLQTLKKIATVLEIDLKIVLHPGNKSASHKEVLLAA